MDITYYVFRLNEHKELELHPDFSEYGYGSKQEIIDILKNKKYYYEIFIIESYVKTFIIE
jgi:hypothetical protein